MRKGAPGPGFRVAAHKLRFEMGPVLLHDDAYALSL